MKRFKVLGAGHGEQLGSFNTTLQCYNFINKTMKASNNTTSPLPEMSLHEIYGFKVECTKDNITISGKNLLDAFNKGKHPENLKDL